MTTSGAAHEAIGDRRSFALIADGMPARGTDRDAGNHGLFKRVLLGALARRDRQPSRLAALARRYLGIAEFNDLISSVEASGRTDELAALAEAVGVRFDFKGLENLASIGSRPVVLFANHPTGGGNVLGLSLLLARQFPAHRILGNQHMKFLRSMARNMIAVDPFCSTAAVNLDSLIKLRHDFGTQYQALGVFPAGISSRIGVTGKISDRPWNDAFARIARRHDALLVPVWFSGRNRLRYYLAARLRAELGFIALPAEFLRLRGQTITVNIGRPIAPDALRTIPGRDAQLSFLRAAVYALGDEPGTAGATESTP